MLSVFLLQLAGGSMLAIGLGRIDDMSWRYLRLVAAVSLAALLAVLAYIGIQGGFEPFTHSEHIVLLVLAIILAAAWLTTNRMQAPSVRFAQRIYASFGGLLALFQSIEPAIAFSAIERSMGQSSGITLLVLADIMLGGMVIGSVTSSMLLGHRYLTDTGMTIAPLRRLTSLFIAVLILRAVTVAIGLV